MLSPLLSQELVQTGLKFLVEKFVHGRTEQQRNTGKMYLWGCASQGDKKVEAWLTVPEGYHFTMLTALKSVEEVLAGKVKAGSYTPSLAFGAEYISSFPEAKLEYL